MPSFVSALTFITLSASSICPTSVILSDRSDLFHTIRYGTFRSLKILRSSLSCALNPTLPSTINRAISVWFKTSLVFCTRSSPSAPSSSYPGVSIITTGPMGSSSMDFFTGSVVVPLTSETTLKDCPVTALTTLDLPAFRIPKNPI